MAQLNDDLEMEFYTRIYDWHTKFGLHKLASVYGEVNAYSKAYVELINSLPKPSESTSADRDFIFGEVISMLMEWSYQQEDNLGVKLGTYAHRALEIKYKNGFFDDAFQESKKTSNLYSEFCHEQWMKKFPENN